MFPQQNEPYEIEPLPAARMDRFSPLARRRYALLRETQRSDSQFPYALLIVILFQTMLMGCAILFLAALVFFNVADFFFRSQEVDRLSAALLQITPAVSAALASPTEELSPTATMEAASIPVSTPVLIDATPTLDPAASGSPLELPTPFEQPTALPFPTETPVIAPPGQPAISPDLQAYVAQVFTPADNLATAVNTLAQLVQNPNLNDQAWIDSVNFQLGVLQSSLSALEFVQPLPGATDIHKTLIGALVDCRVAVSFLTEVINNRDPNQLSNATVYVQRCNTMVAQPAQQIRAYFGSAPTNP